MLIWAQGEYFLWPCWSWIWRLVLKDRLLISSNWQKLYYPLVRAWPVIFLILRFCFWSTLRPRTSARSQRVRAQQPITGLLMGYRGQSRGPQLSEGQAGLAGQSLPVWRSLSMGPSGWVNVSILHVHHDMKETLGSTPGALFHSKWDFVKGDCVSRSIIDNSKNTVIKVALPIVHTYNFKWKGTR